MDSYEFTTDFALDAAGSIPPDATHRLLAAVATIADNQTDLAQRRRTFLLELAELVGADAGFWAWGRGWPDSSSVTPVAIIDFGFTDQQRTVVIEWGLDANTDREFRQPILARMGEAKKSTDVRRDIMSDDVWAAYPRTRRQLARGGWNSWLHSVRYSTSDTWSNMLLLRTIGRDEFGPREAAIVDLAMTSVPWMHSTAEECLPPEAFVGLTARQRTVMLLLLDGLSRKSIARQLGIGEETVGDHIKSIYNHFEVNSAGELAALFLRGR